MAVGQVQSSQSRHKCLEQSRRRMTAVAQASGLTDMRKKRTLDLTALTDRTQWVQGLLKVDEYWQTYLLARYHVRIFFFLLLNSIIEMLRHWKLFNVTPKYQFCCRDSNSDPCGMQAAVNKSSDDEHGVLWNSVFFAWVFMSSHQGLLH